jgi:hypothetical protein
MGHPGLTHPRWAHYTEEDAGYEDADFILFVLECGDELLLTMLDQETFFKTFGRHVNTVVWPLVFPSPPPRERRSFRPFTPMIACNA